MKKTVFLILVSLFFIPAMVLTTARAAEFPDISVGLAFRDTNGSIQQTFDVNEGFEALLSLENRGNDDVIAAKWFSRQDFHLLLRFTRFIDEYRKEVIRATALLDSPDTDFIPVIVDNFGKPIPGQPAEILLGRDSADPWELSVEPFNPYGFYALEDLVGIFEVQALVPGEFFHNFYEGSTDFASAEAAIDCPDEECHFDSNTVTLHIIADKDNDGYSYPQPYGEPASAADCDDNNSEINPDITEVLGNGIDDDCNPLTPDEVIVEAGKATFKTFKITVGFSSHPYVTKELIAGLPIRVFDRSADSCVRRDYGLLWRYWDDIFENCSPTAQGATDPSGMLTVELPPGDYLALGQHIRPEGDPIYIGRRINNLDADETITKRMFIITRAKGRWLPCKHTKRTGSELLIIEPEYVEWDGEEELYPFVFDSQGDWDVSTSVAPPEGFVTDHNNLSEEVNTDLKAVQFTLTDEGTEWVDMEVTHTIKHKTKKAKKKKIEKLKRKIGVKLSKRLAKKKGRDKFGKKLKKQKKRQKKQNPRRRFFR